MEPPGELCAYTSTLPFAGSSIAAGLPTYPLEPRTDHEPNDVPSPVLFACIKSVPAVPMEKTSRLLFAFKTGTTVLEPANCPLFPIQVSVQLLVGPPVL